MSDETSLPEEPASTADVVDARRGLPSSVIKDLRQAKCVMLAVKGREAATVGYVVPQTVAGGQPTERLRVVLIAQGNLVYDEKAEPRVIDLTKPPLAEEWRRFIGFLRAGDRLEISGLWDRQLRLRVGDSDLLYASLNLWQQPAPRPSARTFISSSEESQSVSAGSEGAKPETAASPGASRRRSRDRFDRFTERARRVLQLAQVEAQRLNHKYIGTEHLLLGIVREGEGVAAKVLANLGIELNKVRSAVEFIVGRGDHTRGGDIGLTPRAKRAIELSVEEARRLNHHYIGTEHLLLGLVREGEGIGAGVIESLGVSFDKVRQEVLRVLNQSAAYGPTATAKEKSFEKTRFRRGRSQALSREIGKMGRFSAGALQALQLGREEAEQNRHAWIGVEHLLLGLVAQQRAVAARALGELGINSDRLRWAVEPRFGRYQVADEGEIELTGGAKRALEGAVEASNSLRPLFRGPSPGTGHLLLGILGTDEGAEILQSLDADSEAVRAAVERHLRPRKTGESTNP